MCVFVLLFFSTTPGSNLLTICSHATYDQIHENYISPPQIKNSKTRHTYKYIYIHIAIYVFLFETHFCLMTASRCSCFNSCMHAGFARMLSFMRPPNEGPPPPGAGCNIVYNNGGQRSGVPAPPASWGRGNSSGAQKLLNLLDAGDKAAVGKSDTHPLPAKAPEASTAPSTAPEGSTAPSKAPEASTAPSTAPGADAPATSESAPFRSLSVAQQMRLKVEAARKDLQQDRAEAWRARVYS